MSKINLKANLISEEENLTIETIGIKSDNKIVYKENNITVTIIYFDNKIEMNRVSQEYKIKLIFEKNKKSKSTYTFFGGSKTFELDTCTSALEVTPEYIKVDYELEGNKFSYSLKLGG